MGGSGFQEVALSWFGSKIFLLLPANWYSSKMGKAAAKNCSPSGQNYKAWKGPTGATEQNARALRWQATHATSGLELRSVQWRRPGYVTCSDMRAGSRRIWVLAEYRDLCSSLTALKAAASLSLILPVPTETVNTFCCDLLCICQIKLACLIRFKLYYFKDHIFVQVFLELMGKKFSN